MGFLGDISFGSVKGLLEGAGTFAKDIRSAITGEISPEKKAELLSRADELEAMGMKAQAEINKAEAGNPNLFVSGARPAALWVCVLGFGYTYLLQPLLAWASINFGWIAPPPVDSGLLYQLMIGMLGLGGFRSYEKSKGVARN